jgi:hypothetical protein
MRSTFFAAFAVIPVLFLLSSCGGSGGSYASNSGGSGSSTTISGSVVKGNVAGATVSFKNATTGAVLGSATTDANGNYTFNASFSGDVVIEANGGTYTDEATGRATTLSTPLKGVLNVTGSQVTGVVTPLTSMAYTYAFSSASTPVTAAAYNSMATSIANQFKLSGVNLTTAVPAVTGTMNDYGKVLASMSKYLQINNASLQSVIGTPYSAAQLSQFTRDFNTAYQQAFPGGSITFSFDGTAFNIGGSGGGGGTGTCGVNVQGSVTAAGNTIPLNLNYCVTGIAAGSCTSGNSSLSQVLGAQGGVAGAVNLTYSFSATCAANAITINLQ